MKITLLALALSAVALAQDSPKTMPAPGAPAPAGATTDREHQPAPNSGGQTPPATPNPSSEKPATPPAVDPGPLPTEKFLAQAAKRVGDADGWKIHWEFHVIALPAKKAFTLIPELRDETTIEAGWTKLQAMIEQDEAEFVATNGGQVLNNGEVTSTQGEDLRYPIEFATPFVIETAQAKLQQNEKPGQPLPIGFGPTTFETRKLGITLVLHAAVSDDGKRLQLTTKFERTWLTHWDENEVGRLANNEKLLVRQPRITVISNVGTSGVFAGERILLDSHRVPGEAGKMELAFLRVWTTPRKTPAGK